MKFAKLFIGLFLFTLFAGCSPREEKIDGSIFIATRGGENFKLGLVTVSVFDEQQFAPCLAKTTADLQTNLAELKAEATRFNEEKDSLTRKYNLASGADNDCREKWQAAKELANQTAKKFDENYLDENMELQATRPEFSKNSEEELKNLQNKEAEHEKLYQKYQNMQLGFEPSQDTAGSSIIVV
ncbi:MAG: hypothetical protein WAO21_11490 [Verrucomicrobiia bacterium]